MESYLAEIRLFAGTFAPENWAFCDGRVIAISDNEKLYSLLGTTYGGDGRTNFALPDLRSRVPVGAGKGQGLSYVREGQRYGWFKSSVTLTLGNLPPHTHKVSGSTVALLCNNASPEDSDNPQGNFLSRTSPNKYYKSTANAQMGTSPVKINIEPAGGSKPVDINQPSLGMNYIICIQGLSPSR
ncbi:MAG: phage tail protein [Flavobacteriaceae bacterium]|nr:MAG: phage tail protein [Flavobacteriaceae bacterium]